MKRIGPVFCTLLVAACSSTPETPVSTASSSNSTRPSLAQSAPSAPASVAAARPQQSHGTDHAAAVPGRNSVYFDYDSSIVKQEYQPVVAEHARYAATGAMRALVVEGNTDERGSREYNLALGHRRAQAVKERLMLLGVPATRVEAVSYGEEKPRELVETESAYAQNRRADIVYTSR